MATPWIAGLLIGCLVAPLVGAEEAIVLHDVRLVDGNGGPPAAHVDIVIEDGRIAAIDAAPSGRRTRGRSIDLAGRTVLPGIVSDHSHLGLTDGTHAGSQYATPANILRQLRQYQAYGVTTVVSLGLNQQTYYDVAAQQHAGKAGGAEMYGADRGFGVPDGAPPASMGIGDAQVYRPRSVDEARAQVRESAARHPALLKIWVDDIHGQMPQKLSPTIYRAIIDEGHSRGLRVAAHVYYRADARQLVADGVDILAHGVRDAPLDAELIGAIKAHHVGYVPTLGLDESFYLFAQHPELAAQPLLQHALQPALAAQFADPAWRAGVLGDARKLATDENSVAVNERNAKALVDAGVPIGFGTDSGATPLRIAGFAEHRELELLVAAGLTPLQALQTATKNAAATLRLDDRGTIEPGKRADLIVVDGDPSSDITQVHRIVAVWQNGRQVAGELSTFSP